MSLRYYAYGLAAAAVLTGGVVMFYPTDNPPNPGIGPTADDMAELCEADNERWAALATTRHTGSESNGWNFTRTLVLSNMPVHAQMQFLMNDVTNLCPFYYQETGKVWTVSNLMIAAHVGPGDGRFMFTVGYTTSGVPVYSNRLGALIYTSTFWEVFRCYSNFVLTARAGQWSGGTWYGYGDAHHWWPEIFPITPAGLEGYPIILKQWAGGPGYAPDFFKDISSFAFSAGDVDRLATERIAYSASGQAGGAAYESVDMRVPTEGSMSRMDWLGGNTFYFYSDPIAQGLETAEYLDSTGGLWLATMDSNVTVRIDIPWADGGVWTNITSSGWYSNAVATTQLVSWADAGTDTVNVTFTGMSTNWHTFAAVTGIHYRIQDHVLFWTNEVADCVAFIGGEGPFSDYNKDFTLSQVLPTYMGGRGDATVGTAYLHWTFSKCRP